jgi:hypothetical protein
LRHVSAVLRDPAKYNLRSTLSKRLGRWDNFVNLSGANNDFNLVIVSMFCQGEYVSGKNLDGAAVNEQAVQLLQGPTSSGGVTEGDVGDATALRVGSIGQLNPLNGTNRLNKVLLEMKISTLSARSLFPAARSEFLRLSGNFERIIRLDDRHCDADR